MTICRVTNWRICCVTLLTALCFAAYAQVQQWPIALQEHIVAINDNPNAVVEDITNALPTLLDSPEKAAYYSVLCRANNALLSHDKAQQAALDGLNLISQETSPWLYHQLTLCHAATLNDGSLQTRAKQMTQPALQWARNNGAADLLTYGLFVDGLIDLSLRDLDNALSQFQEGYRITQKQNTQLTTADFAALIALVFEYQGDARGAKTYWQEAENHYRNPPARMTLSSILFGLGRANMELGDTDEGLTQVLESAHLALDVGNLQAAAFGYQQMSEYLIEQGKTEIANEFLLDALSIFESSGNRHMQISVLLSLSRIEKQTGNPAGALERLKQAESLAVGDSYISAMLEINDVKAEVLASMQQYEDAYQLMLNNVELSQDLYQSENSQRLLELQTRFAVEQEKVKNDLLREQNLRQQSQLKRNKDIRRFGVVVGVLLLLVIALLGYLYINVQRHRERLEKLANQDDLTGLMSRRNIMERLEHQLALTKRIQAPLSVAVVDLDHFKVINDSFGHATGDAVLREFGKIALDSFRVSDGLGRIGGEEFLFYFPHTTPSQAAQLLERFAQKVYTIPQRIGNKEVKVSLSAGLAQVADTDETRTVVAKADKALYEAKANGRDRIEIATAEPPPKA